MDKKWKYKYLLSLFLSLNFYNIYLQFKSQKLNLIKHHIKKIKKYFLTKYKIIFFIF